MREEMDRSNHMIGAASLERLKRKKKHSESGLNCRATKLARLSDRQKPPNNFNPWIT